MQVTVSEVSKGDVNGDGKIDITDVMGLCRILARQNIGEEPNDQELLRGDMNGDGFIRIEDVMSVCRVIARQK
ncbi:MAG TPA: dockerin type I repeat-containing protein [Firmicutes bacterium]|nr:dockerin type I repeat-containing protein [Bacillota bacterium]